MSFINKIFGNSSTREIKKIQPLVNKIIALKPQMEALTDEQLQHKTVEFKERLANGETLDDILVDAYATVREATRRVLGTEHYPVQLMGGIILHQGRIAEMKTGEGKTQTCLLPAYLNALTGKGVHIVTVNDYLANRDAEWMGQVHRFLGLTVGCVLNSMETSERQAAYNCDITYITNNELGFDYLRDNMVVQKEKQVQRGLVFAIVDEVDSVLIDEARTPLIISGQSAKSTKLYELADILAKQLVKGEAKELSKMDVIMHEDIEETGDFVVNEKEKIVNLTEEGVKKVEDFFKIENLADPENLEIQHHIILALRAHNLMFRDQQYVVKDDQILIVDEFTGRIMPGRRYSDGLHQAIEAKEHVKVKRESKTLATITFQNFFNKYQKKAGMTGTAKTEENEFQNIYGMDVVEIPTNLPVIRKDLEDAVYKTKKEKYNAVVNEIVKAHENGQPVLVGTITIETSELLSSMLKKRGIKHNVLNAKYHELEAQIVAEAGQHGAVTIATNMAGRGTDIKLDPEAKAAGGLKIIGTERHESRRIDNQLRGRSGRQGDPGESRFYISLEDDLMRLFGSERLMSIFNTLGVAEGEEIQHKMLSNAIERAQTKIENNNFGIRKNLLEYDQVMNDQREIIYAERDRVLNGESMRKSILEMINADVQRFVGAAIVDDTAVSEWDMLSFNEMYMPVFPTSGPVEIAGTKEAEAAEEKAKADAAKKQAEIAMQASLNPEMAALQIKVLPKLPYLVEANGNYKKSDLLEDVTKHSIELYETKEKQFPSEEQLREVERVVLLRVIDRHWMNHIDDMEQLRQGIGLAAYGQKDPLVEYKMQGFGMFDDMIASIQEETVKTMLSLRIEQKIERKQVAQPMATNKDDSLAKAPKKRTDDKVYPNDPCPCGSGKKYKQCCGRKA